LFQEKEGISGPEQALKDGQLPRIQRDRYGGGVHGRRRKGSWKWKFEWDQLYLTMRSGVELWLKRRQKMVVAGNPTRCDVSFGTDIDIVLRYGLSTYSEIMSS
jgi:hypothetical protein